MADNTYFGSGGNMRDLATGQGVDFDLNNQNTIERALQSQFNQQMLSPTTIPQRHDSLFSCSSLGGTPRHSIFQHQAEPQPYANLHHNLHSPNDYSQHPVSNVMSRSASQHSSMSPGQHPHSHSLQRSSRGSFGSTLVSNGSEMSRTISSTSAGQRTALQPYPLPSHSQAGYFHIRRSSDLSPNMAFEQFPTTAVSPFDYGMDNTINEDATGNENENRTFGQIEFGSE
jgi:hypothetical protein